MDEAVVTESVAEVETVLSESGEAVKGVVLGADVEEADSEVAERDDTG